ncbi:MAG: hypothetical protein OEW33_14700, partial [Nitrospirota bacterium]|nr:hypothetical protein [Nitrospirota bacterium]
PSCARHNLMNAARLTCSIVRYPRKSSGEFPKKVKMDARWKMSGMTREEENRTALRGCHLFFSSSPPVVSGEPSSSLMNQGPSYC